VVMAVRADRASYAVSCIFQNITTANNVDNIAVLASKINLLQFLSIIRKIDQRMLGTLLASVYN